MPNPLLRDRDVDFLLYEVLRADELCALPAFADHSRETFDLYLASARRLARDVLFPEDGYVSGLHCRLSWEAGKLMLTDLGSSNGSFVRLRDESDVKSGDVLLMGQQLFRVAVT